MNSEKVKEIKKALEDNANYEHHDKLGYIDGYKCKTVAYADILTLINELESTVFEMSGIIKCHKYCVGVDHCQNASEKEFRLQEKINELESENVRLKNLREVDNTTMTTLRKSNTELNECMDEMQDRIAELEKENGEHKQHITEVEKGIINIARERNKKEELASKFIDSYNDSLKQFAERLKEKFNRQEKRFADTLNGYENDLDKVKESDLPTAKFLIGKATGQATMAEKAQYYIDETLKEFINKGDDN